MHEVPGRGGHYLLGEYETARDHAEKGLKLQKELGVPIVLPPCYTQLALIHLALGDHKSARDCAEEALRLSREFKFRSEEGMALMRLGSIEGKTDSIQIDVAEGHIRQGISILEEREVRAWYAQGYLFLGELFAHAGQRDKAIESFKIAETLYLEMKVTPRSPWLARARDALERLESGPRAK